MRGREDSGARARSSQWRTISRVGVLAVVVLAAGCGTRLRVPLAPFYDRATLDRAEARVYLDMPYRTDDRADPSKHRLDLYLPRRDGWPLMAFVHGGSLENGDSAQRLVGNDIYRNIGRFWASRGVGVALINYRLQPGVTWPEQADDVATAVAWLIERDRRMGGDGRVFLSGHSAGAWLVAHVALDRGIQRSHGIDRRDVAGVISVSGSGFDLTDDRTWEMFGHEDVWRERFSVRPDDPAWKERASVVPLVDATAPPFLLLYSSEEWPALARQNRLFCDALRAAHAPCDLEEIQGFGHRRMALALSRDSGDLTRRILRVLETRQPQATADPG